MTNEIKIPAVGESITEGTIGQWLKKNGEKVSKNEPILLLETDKASVEVVSEWEGFLNQMQPQGATVPIGSVVAQISTEPLHSASLAIPASAAPASATPASAAPASATPVFTTPVLAASESLPSLPSKPPPPSMHSDKDLSPAVRRIIAEKGLDPKDFLGTGRGGRLIKEDLVSSDPLKTKK